MAHGEILNGGCCCGAIRYQVAGPVYHRTSCHCPTCRRVSGAASVAWFSVERAAYRITAGTPAVFHSSAPVTRTFCGNCGTPLTYQRTDSPDEVDVTICSLDDPAPFAPQDHTFTAYRLSWNHSADDIPQFKYTRAEG